MLALAARRIPLLAWLGKNPIVALEKQLDCIW
jgi:hypothetical protein